MTYDLNKPPRQLLSNNNPKILKGEKFGYMTSILHLAPAKLSGVANVCGSSTAGCRAACLNTSGHGGMGLDPNGLNTVQVARIQRTRFWYRHRQEFNRRLHREISNLTKRAARAGMTPAVRLNGTSDLIWERLRFLGYPNVMAAFPDVQFYDYTKHPMHRRHERGTDALPANYSLTFSLSECNDADALDALEAGFNVAVVLDVKRNEPMPRTWAGYPVIDGDETDTRFVDVDGGHIIGLRAKGSAIGDTSGFVRSATGAAVLA